MICNECRTLTQYLCNINNTDLGNVSGSPLFQHSTAHQRLLVTVEGHPLRNYGQGREEIRIKRCQQGHFGDVDDTMLSCLQG
jgi:hypothetical protein